MSQHHPSLTLAATLAAALTLAVAISGCGISDPYRSATQSATATAAPATSPTATTTGAADSGDPPGERGGTIPTAAQQTQRRLAAGAGSATPLAALGRYASLYENWRASGLIARQRQLASISLGQARAQALQAAASAAKDPQLTRSQVTNTGQLIAITPGRGAVAGEWVLVTRERTTGQGDYAGLPPTLHVIYARLTDQPDGWIVSSWQPQT